ncbi:MAG: MFS transporter, partial [Longimicrobiales bacterium]|nr:MFS transporter [Longimicrobiales bacterium]
TLGGAIVGWILAWYGFVEGGVAQDPQTLTGIRMLMSFYPAIFGIVGGAIMFFYPLTDKMMVTIERDLTARHAEAAEPPAS